MSSSPQNLKLELEQKSKIEKLSLAFKKAKENNDYTKIIHFLTICNQDSLKICLEYGIVQHMDKDALNKLFLRVITMTDTTIQANHKIQNSLPTSQRFTPESEKFFNIELIKLFFEQCILFGCLLQIDCPIHLILKTECLFRLSLSSNNTHKLLVYLLENGVPIDLKDKDGKTIEDVANDIRGHRGMLDLNYNYCESLFNKATNTAIGPKNLYWTPWFNITTYLKLRSVNNFNTLLHTACEFNLTMAQFILTAVATLPPQQRFHILTAQNAIKMTPLDILYQRLERCSISERVDQDISEKESKKISEEIIIHTVIKQFRNLMQNLVDKSVISFRQAVKLGFNETSPLNKLPTPLTAKIFQFLSWEPSCNFGTTSESQQLVSKAFYRATVSPTVLSMSERLFLVNKPLCDKVLQEVQVQTQMKDPDKDTHLEKALKKFS